MGIKTTPFDAAEYLDTPEAQAEYLRISFETGDSADIQEAIGTVARARGMTQIARDAGVGRESPYKALDEHGNPEFATILRVVRALGLTLTVTTPVHEHA
ncbi:addiction module antidote protein [Burkholderia contaminans]|uniref:addiction module antidote protein n=1 Tax=Burkholderia contaminans TaxID=488447 RepID=UPI002D8075BC|nr:addiction module antidote protein [Burkholderia contaminans]